MNYQRFVKTTPKPKATKNKSGELVGPFPLPLLPVLEGLGVLALVGVDAGEDEVSPLFKAP